MIENEGCKHLVSLQYKTNNLKYLLISGTETSSE